MKWITQIIETYQKGKLYDELKQDFLDVSGQNIMLKSANLTLSSELKDEEAKVEALQGEIHELTFEADVNAAEYWNNKWARSTVYYSAPKRKNVTEYVKFEEIPGTNYIAHLLCREYNLRDRPVDDVPLEVLKWFEAAFKEGEFKYKLDSSEVWSSASQVYDRKEDDCDGFGVLMYDVIRKVFKIRGEWEKVKHRLKCWVGNVNHRGNIPYPNGSHFANLWLADDGYWYLVESTYYRERSIRNFLKLPHKFDQMYGTTWFTFNEDFAWSDHNLAVDRIDFKKYEKSKL